MAVQIGRGLGAEVIAKEALSLAARRKVRCLVSNRELDRRTPLLRSCGWRRYRGGWCRVATEQMPKIKQGRVEENQRRIEAAALALFTKQGFHGTNIRQIAEKAEVSTGAIYTYYATKEALFVSLVRNYETRMKPLRDQMFTSIKDPFSKQDIRKLATEIRSIVYDNADYWLLMYIDVIEFKNQHFAQSFQGVVEKMQHRLGPLFSAAKRQKGWCGKDPAFVFASIYMYVFQYFLIEKLFQGNQHLGVSDDEAVDGFVDLFSHGIWNHSKGRRRPPGPAKTIHHLGSISGQKRKLRAFAFNGGSQ